MHKLSLSMSTVSEVDSLSLSLHGVRPDSPPAAPSSLQQLHDADFPKRINFKIFGGADGDAAMPTSDHTRTAEATATANANAIANAPLPNPFAHEAQQHELHGMFARDDYSPRPASALWTLLGLAVGVGLGVLLTQTDASPAVVAWVKLPGDLYLDALLCVVVPATFCKVVVAGAETVGNATVRPIACVAALWFALSSLLASGVGTLFAAIFAATFRPSQFVGTPAKAPQLAFQCASDSWLRVDALSGAVSCGAPSAASPSNETLFTVQDTDAFFARSSTAFATVTLTDQVVGILSNMIPTNVLAGFVDGTYVSVVFMALFFAVACAYGHDSRQGVPNYILLILTQAQVFLRIMLNELLKLLPMAVVSIVAGSIAVNESSIGVVHDVVYLVIALLAAAAVFLVLGMGAALFLTTRRGIWGFLAHLLPAQAFALGSGSTIATLPMTIRCVDASGDVPRALARIVLSFGATCNLTGMSLYVPLAVVFLAKTSGLELALSADKYALLWALGAIAGYGAKSVESAEMVMVLTVWRAVFHTEPSELVATLVVADWLLQRVRALVNVTTHAMLARIVAEHCRESKRQKEQSEFLVDDEFAMASLQRTRDPTHNF